jgi:A/G-specific adenine glycosylase
VARQRLSGASSGRLPDLRRCAGRWAPETIAGVMPISPLHEPVLAWYAANARELPWRDRSASPWAVLVSEVMLQQTPVARVLPVYLEWVRRWPAPADLAAAAPGAAVRAWGRLGYPRRALRLHEAAAAVVERHDGRVPSSYEDLLALPGVGAYTAAAVASFAFRSRHPVLDTNVRRVLARTVSGRAQPTVSLSAAERRVAEELLPDDADLAATWAVAVMELGALVCTARAPRCADCPVADLCRWHAGGHPDQDGPPRRIQRFAGTDRQVRGLLLAVLREADGPVPGGRLDVVWSDGDQRRRALDGLVSDGLVEPVAGGKFQLPT